MNARAAIVKAIESAERHVADLRTALAAIDDGGGKLTVPTAASRATPDKLVDTAAATKITARSSSWLYATARKHPDLGWKVASGSWVWSASSLRAFMAGRAAQCEESEICEVCDAPAISKTPKRAHLPSKTTDRRLATAEGR